MSRAMKAEEPLYRARITVTYPPSRWREKEETETYYIGPYTSTGPARRAVTKETQECRQWRGATAVSGVVEQALTVWVRVE